MEFSFTTLRLILQTNFAPIVSIFVLVAFIKTNVSFSDKINRSFLLISAACLLLTASDNMRFYSSQLDHPTFFRYLSTGVGYILRPTILYLLTGIASRYKSRRNILFIIPLIFCYILSTLSIFQLAHGIMFRFNEQNVNVRGPFGLFSHSLCIFYAIQIVYYSFKSYNHRFEPIVIIIMEFAAFFATVMEHSFHYDFVLSQTLISSIIFYYFYLLTQTYKRDTLTNFLTRRCFYLEANHILKYPMTLLSMDLNNLKLYNDTKGHAAGDQALVTVSQEMYKHFSKHAKLYRTGGDEFMAIFKKGNFDFIEGLVNNFQEDLKKTEYRVACGIASYTPGDDIEKIITICDERMYSNKIKIKKEEGFKVI